jgi:hypothetical protein
MKRPGKMLGKKDYDRRTPPSKLAQLCGGCEESDILYGISELFRRLETIDKFYVSEPGPPTRDSTVASYKDLHLTFCKFSDALEYGQDVNIILWYYPA